MQGHYNTPSSPAIHLFNLYRPHILSMERMHLFFFSTGKCIFFWYFRAKHSMKKVGSRGKCQDGFQNTFIFRCNYCSFMENVRLDSKIHMQWLYLHGKCQDVQLSPFNPLSCPSRNWWVVAALKGCLRALYAIIHYFFMSTHLAFWCQEWPTFLSSLALMNHPWILLPQKSTWGVRREVGSPARTSPAPQNKFGDI